MAKCPLGKVCQIMRQVKASRDRCRITGDVPEIERETLLDRLMTHCADNANLNHLTYAISALEANGDVDDFFLARIRISLLCLSSLKRLRKHLPVSRSYMQHLRVEEARILRAYARGFAFRDASSQCEETLVCYSEVDAWKDRLFLEFLSLILSEATHDAEESIDASFNSQEFLEIFLGSLKQSSVKRSCCLFSQLREPERIGGFAVHGRSKPTLIANTEGPSREWRTKVASNLLESAQACHETVIQQMQAICQDFETRCMKVEEPLAVAFQERDQLKQQLEDSKCLNLELEAQARQSMELVDTLKKQIGESIKQVNEHSLQVEHLTEQVDALQTELDDTRKESQESIESVRLKARDRELDLMATVAERDDLLEEQQTEINSMSKERARFKEAMDSASEHHRTISRECDALRQAIARLQKEAAQERDTLRHEASKLQQVMEIRESTNVEKDNQIMALSSTAKDLRSENHMLKDKLDQEKSNAMALVSSLEEARQNYQTSIAHMETRFEEQMSQAHKQAQQMTDRHNLEVADLRKNAANATAKSEKELRVKDKRVQQLEKKVESLRNERAAKAREFSEAQEHISRLMSVMGFTKDYKDESNKRQLDTTPTVNREVRRSTRPSELQTQSCPPSQSEMTTMHTQYSIAPPPPRVTEFVRPDTTTRRRSHRSAEAMSFANDPNYSFLPEQKERQPLGHLDRNSPIKSSQPHNPKESKCNNQESPVGSPTNINMTELGDIDLDFDDDDLLTSTLPR
ncbi:hypothetical protein UA08_01932 [Talaromyces atroroseus]|uniref:Uncharacterized protein n=1 Tax=Talaromyces atroroseus TaxID=1441469 RepID=A0A1Q5QAQ9_TALAT|nr:hypothetical protein UA08_01932 [Talaromyces atroroseus]OKL63033.1 hypothetical protein UA08_01932 [Talaromyces atroroseus]